MAYKTFSIKLLQSVFLYFLLCYFLSLTVHQMKWGFSIARHFANLQVFLYKSLPPQWETAVLGQINILLRSHECTQQYIGHWTSYNAWSVVGKCNGYSLLVHYSLINRLDDEDDKLMCLLWYWIIKPNSLHLSPLHSQYITQTCIIRVKTLGVKEGILDLEQACCNGGMKGPTPFPNFWYFFY